MFVSANEASLHITPVHSYFDETVHITVRGLLPKQTVTVMAKVKDVKAMIFQSSAEYTASENGEVDLMTSPSMGGTYKGVEPMGLFWSLEPLTPHNKFTWWDASRPLLVDIMVISHDTPGHVLARGTLQRHFMKEGVQKVVVADGRLRGFLFIPPGE